MHCFYHDNVEAVAICKSCNRGVCHECAAEFANGVACKNRCEAEVAAVNEVIERSKTSYQKTSSAYSRNAAVYLMLTVVFGAWGVSELTARPLVGGLIALLAAVFLIAAFFNYSTSRKYLQSGSDKRP